MYNENNFKKIHELCNKKIEYDKYSYHLSICIMQNKIMYVFLITYLLVKWQKEKGINKFDSPIFEFV